MLVADFETLAPLKKEKDFLNESMFNEYLKNFKTGVWLSAFADVENLSLESTFIQTEIKTFFFQLVNYCIENKPKDQKEIPVFFHNLKFDGSFITNYLLSIDLPFETFISDMGVWYSISIQFEGFKITFRDSLKILNFPLANFPKIFGLETFKGDTPLLEKTPTEILPEWKDYIYRDIYLLGSGIYAMYRSENFTKFTSASESLKNFKKTLKYRSWFPMLDYPTDDFIRKSYKGGWTFANPKHQGKLLNKEIHIYDINSMYPSVMLDHHLPVGTPIKKTGKPEFEKDKLYICKIYLCAKLKKDHLPTFQTKDIETAMELDIKRTEYITDTNDEYYEFHFTNYDIELIEKHYECDIRYLEYYEFRTEKGLFNQYITKYKNLKENAKTDSEKQMAKIMLNSLYGKFGSKIYSAQKTVFLGDFGQIRFNLEEQETTDPNYIPLATFITSIARYNIINSAQSNYKNFLYADTDSLHLLHDPKNPVDLKIDSSKFGYWKLENVCIKAKYLRAKLYAELIKKDDGSIFLDVKGAGMTNDIKKQVTFDNFKFGHVFKNKKASAQVKGGQILYDTTFTIKKSDIGF